MTFVRCLTASVTFILFWYAIQCRYKQFVDFFVIDLFYLAVGRIHYYIPIVLICLTERPVIRLHHLHFSHTVPLPYDIYSHDADMIHWYGERRSLTTFAVAR